MDVFEEQVIGTLSALTKARPITTGMALRTDLGLDSIRIITALTRLSRKLNVSILDFTDRELMGLKSVQDLVVIFTEKSQAQARS